MQIKIYSTPICSYCHLLKDYLKKNNFAFEDVNVADDVAAAEAMVKKSGQMGVPVTSLITDQGQEEIIVGFDKVRLNQLLGIK